QVLEITLPERGPAASADLPDLMDRDLSAEPLLPARVKWFDRAKGFGFANVWGRAEDVFLHAEVLRRSGFAELLPGEAIGLKVVQDRRGLMAGEVTAWDAAPPGVALP